MKIEVKFTLSEAQLKAALQDWAQDNIVSGLVLDSIDMYSYELRATGHIGEDDQPATTDDQEGE